VGTARFRTGGENIPAEAVWDGFDGATGHLRVRIGDYRVIYVLHDDILIVVVVDVGHRRKIYDS
jgi:mRNA-degrading endonuclease RelE of RelBE toxin-antitoxin system